MSLCVALRSDLERMVQCKVVGVACQELLNRLQAGQSYQPMKEASCQDGEEGGV